MKRIHSVEMIMMVVALVLSTMWSEQAWTQNSTLRDGTWMTDGQVNAIVRSSDTVYIGGFFSHVGSNTGHGVPIDSLNGQPVATFPMVKGDVRVSISDGSGGWYIGGDFTEVGGEARNRIAHILANGAVDPSWNPDANNTVRAFAISGSTIYVGGMFSSIGGQTRNNIASLDATTGNATDWNPSADNLVLALSVSGSTIFAGGSFRSIGGQTRNRIAAIDATTGTATPWNPSADSTVETFAISGSTIYAGGLFHNIGGQTRNYIAALDVATGNATNWNPNASFYIYTLSVSGSTVYAGGLFRSIGGQNRNYIAALDVSTGNATTWDPNAQNRVFALAVSGSTVYVGGDFTSIGGQARNNIAALDATTGTATNWDPNAEDWVWALAVSGSTVYVGGNFGSIGGQTRNNIAAFDATSGIVTDWNPNADDGVNVLVVSGSIIYAGGRFTSIGGQSRSGIAKLDASTGNATDWNPSVSHSSVLGSVSALSISGSTVYAGGTFNNIGGQSRNNIAALDTSTGIATNWDPNANNPIWTLTVSGSTVYAGGRFNTIGGQTRNYIAALDASTGNATVWDPNATPISVSNEVSALVVSGSTVYAGGRFNSIGGQSRNNIAALDSTTGNATDWNPDAEDNVTALVVSDTIIYAGGKFNNIGGQTRNNIAELDDATGNATIWNPSATGGFVRALAVFESTVYVGGSFTKINKNPRQGFAEFDLSILINLAPSFESVRLETESPDGFFPITAIGEGFMDPEEADEAYVYQWFVNGVQVPGEISNILSNEFFTTEDLVTALVYPFDGIQTGTPITASIRIAAIITNFNILPIELIVEAGSEDHFDLSLTSNSSKNQTFVMSIDSGTPEGTLLEFEPNVITVTENRPIGDAQLWIRPSPDAPSSSNSLIIQAKNVETNAIGFAKIQVRRPEAPSILSLNESSFVFLGQQAVFFGELNPPEENIPVRLTLQGDFDAEISTQTDIQGNYRAVFIPEATGTVQVTAVTLDAQMQPKVISRTLVMNVFTFQEPLLILYSNATGNETIGSQITLFGQLVGLNLLDNDTPVTVNILQKAIKGKTQGKPNYKLIKKTVSSIEISGDGRFETNIDLVVTDGVVEGKANWPGNDTNAPVDSSLFELPLGANRLDERAIIVIGKENPEIPLRGLVQLIRKTLRSRGLTGETVNYLVEGNSSITALTESYNLAKEADRVLLYIFSTETSKEGILLSDDSILSPTALAVLQSDYQGTLIIGIDSDHAGDFAGPLVEAVPENGARGYIFSTAVGGSAGFAAEGLLSFSSYFFAGLRLSENLQDSFNRADEFLSISQGLFPVQIPQLLSFNANPGDISLGSSKGDASSDLAPPVILYLDVPEPVQLGTETSITARLFEAGQVQAVTAYVTASKTRQVQEVSLPLVSGATDLYRSDPPLFWLHTQFFSKQTKQGIPTAYKY